MQLTLIRHTSVDVPSGICYGKTDVPLASTFKSELNSIRKKLEGETFDAVYSSPLSRCVKLANQIVPENDIQIDHRLTELDFGAWEMTEWNTISESSEGINWFTDYVNVRCPKGESFADLLARSESFLKILQQSKYQNIAIFTHAGVIRAMISLIQDISPKETFNVPIAYGQIITLYNYF